MAHTTGRPRTANKAQPATPSSRPGAEKAAAKTAGKTETDAPVKIGTKVVAPKAAVKAANKRTQHQLAELTAADLVGIEGIEPEGSEPVEKAGSAASIAAQENPAKQESEVEAPVLKQDGTKHIIEAAGQAEKKGTQIMSDVMETTKKYADEAKVRFQSAFSEMSEKAKANVEKSSKAFEEMSDIAKGNVEALVESGKIASKGVESMGQEAAEYGRMSFEKASAAMKSLAAVKSPTEFFQLQSELFSSSFDAFAKEAAKNSEAMLKLAGDVAQPISTRVSVVTDRVRQFAA